MKARRFGTLVAIVSLAAGALAAEPPAGPAGEATAEAGREPGPSELLAFTVRFETVGGSELFGSELDWMSRGPARMVTLGVSSSRIEDDRWVYAKAGAARRVSEKTLLSAAVDLGEGERAGSAFGYRKIRARVTHLPVPARLELFAEAQSYEVGRFHGTLVSVGASYRFRPAVAVGLGYSELVAGNSESRIAFGRIDLERPLGFFAGFAHGTQGPGVAQVTLGLRPDAEYSEVYAGISVPLRNQRLLLLLDLAEHGETRRRAIVASWRLRWHASNRGTGG